MTQPSQREDASAADSSNGEPVRSTLLEGRLGSCMLWLALPVLAEQLLNYAVGITDTYLSGRISKEATAAVGIGAYVNWLIEIIFAILGTGTAALVARHWGAGERQEARHVAACAYVLAVGLGISVAAGLFVAAPLFGEILGLSEEVHPLATRFLQRISIGHLFSSMCLIGGAALRGAGSMRVPMVVLGLVSVLNVLFTTSLVFGVGPIPALGIDGISLGTVIARAVGGVLMTLVLLSSVTDLSLRGSLAAAGDLKAIQRILKIGFPAACDGLLMWCGHMLYLRLIASLGSGATADTALAAHMVFNHVEAVTYLPAWAWGTAAATMMGQCLGAGLLSRGKQGVHAAARQACLLAAIVTVLFWFGATTIFRFMHSDPAVAELGGPALSTLALMEIPLTLAIVYTAAVRGGGNTVVPLIVNSLCVFGVRLPVGYLGAVVWDGGLLGAWCGMAADQTLRAVLILLYFRCRLWRTTEAQRLSENSSSHRITES